MSNRGGMIDFSKIEDERLKEEALKQGKGQAYKKARTEYRAVVDLFNETTGEAVTGVVEEMIEVEKTLNGIINELEN